VAEHIETLRTTLIRAAEGGREVQGRVATQLTQVLDGIEGVAQRTQAHQSDFATLAQDLNIVFPSLSKDLHVIEERMQKLAESVAQAVLTEDAVPNSEQQRNLRFAIAEVLADTKRKAVA